MTKPSIDCDLLLLKARLATMSHDTEIIDDNACVAIAGGHIIYSGPATDAINFRCETIIDCDHRLVTPGLIDCHTHLIYGGDRSNEHELKLKGAAYAEISAAGGGILSSVRATRDLSEDELVISALKRLDPMIAEGLCTIEIKSGYGLSLASELKMLKAARRLEGLRPISVSTSLLAAHTLPPEFMSKDAYIDHVCDVIMPEVSRLGLADAVDGFCEGIAFSKDQIRRVFVAAKAYGLKVKLHAEQLSALGGAAMAAQCEALSCDHLEYATETDLVAMKTAGSAAVLLPGAFYFLRQTKAPPVEMMRKLGLMMAVGTDCNPGTSPLSSPLVAMNMAMVLFGLNPYEALMGMTRAAAFALGQGQKIGQIKPNFKANLVIWDCENPAQLLCQIGQVKPYTRIFEGRSS
jgi:imidazolonepropionase